MSKATFGDSRNSTADSKPTPGLSSLQLPNGVSFPPQNMMRFGNAVFPTEVLRAPLMQTQLRGTGIYQLINTANGASSVQKPGAHQPRIAVANRPQIVGQTATSSPFLNMMLRAPSTVTGESSTFEIMHENLGCTPGAIVSTV